MKKISKILLPLFIVVILTGCSSKNYKSKTCSLSLQNTEDNYTLTLTRDIYYDGEYVMNTVSHDKIEASNNAILNKYEKQFEDVKKQYDGIKYYDVTISNNGGMLDAVTKVDYTKVDTNKIIKITNNNDLFEKDGKLKVSKLIKSYEDQGLECK